MCCCQYDNLIIYSFHISVCLSLSLLFLKCVSNKNHPGGVELLLTSKTDFSCCCRVKRSGHTPTHTGYYMNRDQTLALYCTSPMNLSACDSPIFFCASVLLWLFSLPLYLPLIHRFFCLNKRISLALTTAEDPAVKCIKACFMSECKLLAFYCEALIGFSGYTGWI